MDNELKGFDVEPKELLPPILFESVSVKFPEVKLFRCPIGGQCDERDTVDDDRSYATATGIGAAEESAREAHVGEAGNRRWRIPDDRCGCALNRIPGERDKHKCDCGSRNSRRTAVPSRTAEQDSLKKTKMADSRPVISAPFASSTRNGRWIQRMVSVRLFSAVEFVFILFCEPAFTSYLSEWRNRSSEESAGTR